MHKFNWRVRGILLGAIFCGVAQGHGIVGDRFFPPTMATDDPFATDELALPTLSYGRDGGDSEFDAGFEFDKEIFPNFAVGVEDTYITQNPAHGPSVQGFDDLTLTAKYEFLHVPDHEFVMSVGLETDLGGTGDTEVERDAFSTFTPEVFFGKGFGDLPDSVGALQPIAVTGSFGQSFPTSRGDGNTFDWGFAVEYSIPYLNQHVHDAGLPEPFKNMIPLVEFAMSTSENGEDRGVTTGTVNPGVLWETKQFQLGVEANIPINDRSGDHVGVTVQLWIFIDDLMPSVFGHPMFGGEQ
jgi:hypothetical protein